MNILAVEASASGSRVHQGLAGIATLLARTLPAGASVAVGWHDPLLGSGTSTSERAGSRQVRAVEALLGGAAASGAKGTELSDAWTLDATRMALVVDAGDGLPDGLRDGWLALARSTIDATFASARAQSRIEGLRKSERLRQALYQIADLSGSNLDMQEMLARIHAIVGTLMPAENFYIVRYDDVRDTVRFLYFVDQRDPWKADPDQEIPLSDMPNSLTVAMLRHGRPLLGPSDRVRRMLGVERDPAHGPDSADWLGVPMRRDGYVGGAVVVQSYDQPERYTHEDRALLEFVAQHILTALDRKSAREELERRVEERTRELQHANWVLEAEIVERERAERLQRALFRISELSTTAGSIERFYAEVHGVIDELLDARNFYIALLSDDGRRLEFPYSVDERDPVRKPRPLGHGLTEYVLRTGRALLVDRYGMAQLEEAGQLRSHGSRAHCWLGVPLSRDGTTVGVIAVQSYTAGTGFTTADQELLTFVAHHIDSALARKRAQEWLKAAHAELESRVEARTRELEQANRELRAQIGERVRAQQRLTHQARHDHLTGLPNRVFLLDRLDSMMLEMHQAGRQPFAVLFLDLDRFKLINDSMGHAAGDAMLIEVGRRIRGAIGASDMVARLGGDEFAIVLDSVADADAADAVAARIQQKLGRSMWVAGRELFPSASIGIALWQPRYRHADELLRDADAAMYRAKARGRDRSERFDEEMRAEAIRLLDLEADLRRAIQRDAFDPYFQPIVRLADGAVVGHEALLRWKHEQHGHLPPSEFLRVCEDSGLIEQVDWLLYRRVVDWMGRHPDGYVSINVSPRHFHADDFADRLLEMAREAGVDPRRLRIEITEGALLDDAPRAARILGTLREKGVVALLDDFGTGFSALSYLHRFPIQALKIDQSFIAGLAGDTQTESLALVRAILALASTLGIETIGEGVETEQQRKVLADLGCTYGQGFLFGRPMPPREGQRRRARPSALSVR
ncbi:diguanylate cyclase (GGDEF)-like protein [Luteimonas sp. J16]|uniref:sensor domain-containing phosphodiesterase n=1 Tax=unclassified Luteimonas TaxID=2629088 RepID=UPI0011AC7EEF|nr:MULTISPECIES: EAL domain-containing protein [unclassified Luteimonas]TWG94568.1 diguanylate cyclase (GGDEF)-like protein [Luteimonas sp. J16]